MKKFFAVFLSIIAVVTMLSPIGAFAYDHVTDRGILLDESQVNILEWRCAVLADEEEFGLIICLEDLADAQQRITELVTLSSFKSGAVFFIDTKNEKVYFKPYGTKISETFTEEVCAQIEAIAVDKVSRVGYYDSCRSVIANTEAVLKGESPEYSGSAYMPSVIDEAGYLTYDEQEELTKKLDSIRNTYNFDVAVVIEREMQYDDAADAANDIYDYNFYGIGEDSEGILFYISKNPRKYYFTFYPPYHPAFEGNGFSELEDNVVPYLKSDDYYNAISEYADTVESLLSSSSGESDASEEDVDALSVIIFSAGISLIIALIATFIKSRKMNNAITEKYAANYVRDGSFSLRVSNDIFMYSHISKRERPKQNTSTVTKSSSGRSHGGGGGSY